MCLGAALRCVFHASACARVCRMCMPCEGGGGHGTKAGLSARSEVAWGQVPLSAILSSHLTCRPAGPQFPSLMSEGFRQGPSQGPCSLDSECGAHSAELGAQSRLWQSPAATPSVQRWERQLALRSPDGTWVPMSAGRLDPREVARRGIRLGWSPMLLAPGSG